MSGDKNVLIYCLIENLSADVMKVREVHRLRDETMESAPPIFPKIMIARVLHETALPLPDPMAVPAPEVVSVLVEDLHLSVQVARGVSLSYHFQDVDLLRPGQLWGSKAGGEEIFVFLLHSLHNVGPVVRHLPQPLRYWGRDRELLLRDLFPLITAVGAVSVWWSIWLMANSINHF